MGNTGRRDSFDLLDLKAAGTVAAERVIEILVSSVRPNSQQPRRVFPADSLMELAASIKKHGLQQPIIVRELDHPGAPGGADIGPVYEIISGERRLRAHDIAGLKVVRAIIRRITDDQLLRLAIVENVHREDLSILDRATAFCRLKDQYHAGKVEPAAEDLKISRSMGFNYNKIGSAEPKYQQLIAKHELDIRGSNFLLTLAAKVAKELPDKTEEFENAVNNGQLGIATLKRLHDEYFPAEDEADEKPRGPGKGTIKDGPASVKRGLFWKTETELGLELLLSRGEKQHSASYAAAATAARKFFKAAGFKTVKIEL